MKLRPCSVRSFGTLEIYFRKSRILMRTNKPSSQGPKIHGKQRHFMFNSRVSKTRTQRSWTSLSSLSTQVPLISTAKKKSLPNYVRD